MNGLSSPFLPIPILDESTPHWPGIDTMFWFIASGTWQPLLDPNDHAVRKNGTPSFLWHHLLSNEECPGCSSAVGCYVPPVTR